MKIEAWASDAAPFLRRPLGWSEDRPRGFSYPKALSEGAGAFSCHEFRHRAFLSAQSRLPLCRARVVPRRPPASASKAHGRLRTYSLHIVLAVSAHDLDIESPSVGPQYADWRDVAVRPYTRDHLDGNALRLGPAPHVTIGTASAAIVHSISLWRKPKAPGHADPRRPRGEESGQAGSVCPLSSAVAPEGPRPCDTFSCIFRK